MAEEVDDVEEYVWSLRIDWVDEQFDEEYFEQIVECNNDRQVYHEYLKREVDDWNDENNFRKVVIFLWRMFHDDEQEGDIRILPVRFFTDWRGALVS